MENLVSHLRAICENATNLSRLLARAETTHFVLLLCNLNVDLHGQPPAVLAFQWHCAGAQKRESLSLEDPRDTFVHHVSSLLDLFLRQTPIGHSSRHDN